MGQNAPQIGEDGGVSEQRPGDLPTRPVGEGEPTRYLAPLRRTCVAVHRSEIF